MTTKHKWYGDRPLLRLSFEEHMKLTSPTIWVTNDNRRIRVRDMEDDHLLRTIRMLIAWGEKNRTKEALELLLMKSPNGEEAQSSLDCEINWLMSPFTLPTYLALKCPPWKSMLKEATKRGLEQPRRRI